MFRNKISSQQSPNPKKLRVLFIDDDEDLEIVSVLKNEGYDVEHLHDVENLGKLVDGRYHVLFIDVRGIGGKYGGNGLDVLRHVATMNPLIFRVVFSAKPFTANENEITRQYANRILKKDCSVYEFIEIIDQYAKSLNWLTLVNLAQSNLPLGWYEKLKLKKGYELSKNDVERIIKRAGTASDAVLIVKNVTSILSTLFAIFT